MKELPKISIVIPSFNQGEFIAKAIESVLSQGYPNIELIIIDGGSSDRTVDVLRKYERNVAFWVSESDCGQSHAINKGLHRATGDILTWLNCDDWYLPGAFRRFTQLLASNPDADVVVGAGRIVDVSGAEVYFKAPTAEINLTSLFRWVDGGNFLQPASAFSRRAWELAGPLNETVHIALDLDLWIRMARAELGFATTSEVLAEALTHPRAKTTAYADSMFMDCAITIVRHGGEPYVRERLEDVAAQLAWYRDSYSSLAKHPILRVLRAVNRRIFGNEARSDWRSYLPPWRKNL